MLRIIALRNGDILATVRFFPQRVENFVEIILTKM